MPSPKGGIGSVDPTALLSYCGVSGITRISRLPNFQVGGVTMDDQNQTQENRLGLTKRETNEESFHLEDFWRHQLERIKEVAESEQSPKEGARGFDQ